MKALQLTAAAAFAVVLLSPVTAISAVILDGSAERDPVDVVTQMLQARGHPVPETALVNGVEVPFEEAIDLLQPISQGTDAEPLVPTRDAGFALRGTEINCRTAAWVQVWSWNGVEPFVNTEFTEVPEAPSGTVDVCQHDYATGTARAEVNPELDPQAGDFWLACLDAGQGGPSNPYWAWAVGNQPCHHDDFTAFSMTGTVGLLRVEFGSLIVEQWHGGVDHDYPNETESGAAVTLTA